MYRILVADDEGIMLEAFKSVIAGAFGEECVVETAKTGRAVTEIAETFHPDGVYGYSYARNQRYSGNEGDTEI